MKYLLLNKTLPENPEYGHYVSYTDSTDKVEYSFGYSTTNSLDRVTKAITGLSATLTDHDICIYGRGQGYSDSFWLTYGGELQGDPGTGFTWFPGLSVYQDNTGREVNLGKLWAALSTYYSGHGDMGGWAGELVRYAASIKTEFPESRFIEVFDAYNISRLGMSLSDAITEYYGGLTETDRILGFKTGGQNISFRFTGSSDYQNLRSMKTSLFVTDDTMTRAISQMQEFLNQN